MFRIPQVLVNMQVRFEDGFLKVWVGFQDKEDTMEQLSTAILHLWRYRPFSDSRWLTLGETCRSLMKGFLTGLHHVISRARANPKHSDWHLHCWDSMSSELKRDIVQCGLCSYVADSFLCEALSDDRVARRLGEFEDAVDSEVDFVASISTDVWDVFGNMSGANPRTLRSDTMSSAHLCQAFLDMRVFRSARGFRHHASVNSIRHAFDF